MEYKCVPAPTGLEIGAKDSFEVAVRSYADLINKEVSGGWKFHSLEQIPITQNPGCIAACCGKTAVTINFNMLIFAKE
jgi:hypothetical protein